MKSIRTPLSAGDAEVFRSFLGVVGLTDIFIGNYEHISERWYRQDCLCYAYNEKDEEVVALMTYISLKYGSLYSAFCRYMIDIQTSSVNDPYFNWTL
jgi:hypothetical protein